MPSLRLRHAALAAAVVAAVLPAGASAGRVVLEDALPASGSTRVTIAARGPAAFTIVVRAPADGRTRLFLLGRHAPRGGPLIDTRTYGCRRSGSALVCRGSYEPLPAGAYTFEIVRSAGTRRGAVLLTVRW